MPRKVDSLGEQWLGKPELLPRCRASVDEELETLDQQKAVEPMWETHCSQGWSLGTTGIHSMRQSAAAGSRAD